MLEATVVLSIVLIILVAYINIYNGIVAKKNQVHRSFSSIDVLLKKRCDLIPNLVAIVKHYMTFEQKTLAKITKLRSQVMTGNISTQQRLSLESQISRSMGNILAMIENYPELQSNYQANQLIETLTEVEEQISAARRFFNTAITEYNNALEMFPSNIVASFMGYRLKDVFVANTEDRKNINVDGLFKS